MMKRLKLVTGPSLEPVTRDEARTFLRLTETAENTLVDELIKASRRSVENYLNLALINQTWQMWLDGFPKDQEYAGANAWWDGYREASISVLNTSSGEIEIPKGPLSSVTSLVTYNDSDTESTFSATKYIVSTAGQYGRIVLKTGEIWPVDLRPADAVKITFVAGYGADASYVPESIKIAMKQLLSHWFENRESATEGALSEMPMSVKMILDPYRVRSL